MTEKNNVPQDRMEQLIGQAVDAIRQMPAPPMPPAVQAAAVAKMRQAARKPRLILLYERIKNMNKLIKYPVAAAAGAILLIAIAAFIAPTVLGGKLAWADVAASIRNAKTMVFWQDQTVTAPGGTAQRHRLHFYVKSPSVTRDESWPVTASASAPATGPVVFTYLSLFNIPDGQDHLCMWTKSPGNWERWVYIGPNGPIKDIERPDRLLRGLQSIQDKDVSRTGQEDVDGVKTTRFDAAISPQIVKSLDMPPGSTGRIQVWVSQASGLPVRVHAAGTQQVGNSPTLEFDVVADKIEWDVPFADSLFRIPDGQNIIRESWQINCPERVSREEFTFRAGIEGQPMSLSEKDGSILVVKDSAGNEVITPLTPLTFMLGDAKLKELTSQHVGEVLVMEVAGKWTFTRKIEYPVSYLVVGCPIPSVAALGVVQTTTSKAR